MEREISISLFTLHFCHRIIDAVYIGKKGWETLVQSIGRNESNVDSNDINWRARVGTKISHAMQDLDRTMFRPFSHRSMKSRRRGYRFENVRLTFVILSGRRNVDPSGMPL